MEHEPIPNLKLPHRLLLRDLIARPCTLLKQLPHMGVAESKGIKSVRQHRTLGVDLSANAQEDQVDLMVPGIGTVELIGRSVCEASESVEPDAMLPEMRSVFFMLSESAVVRQPFEFDTAVTDPQLLTAEHEAVYAEADFGGET